MKKVFILGLCLAASLALGQFFMFGPNGIGFQCPPPTGGGSSYVAKAVTFSSTTVTSVGNLTGASGISSKKVTWSFWIKTTSTAQQEIMDQDGGDIHFQFVGSDGHFTINHFTTGNASGGCNFVSNATAVTSGSGWHHVALSYDSGASVCQLYIDGTAATFATGPSFVNANLYWNDGTFAMGKSAGGFIVGSVADVWVSAVDQIDFSNSANLQKFRSSGGKPVNLGADGSTPTGTAPIIFLTGDATVNSFTNNAGTGGRFSVTAGTLTTDSSGP